MRHNLSSLIRSALAALALLPATCMAQADSAESDDFIPREHVIFYDDFSEDAEGAFPAHWYIKPCCGAKPYMLKRLCQVSRSSVPAMVVSTNHGTNGIATDNLPEPNLKEKDYMPDSFTLQFDFLLGDSIAEMNLHFHELSPILYPFRIYYKEGKGWIAEAEKENHTIWAVIPGGMDAGKWQHFAMAYKKQKATCYLNDMRVLTVNNYPDPLGFILSVGNKSKVSYTNVRLATGKLLMGEHYNFSRLFSADKFTTHSIHFDTRQSTIQPGSMEFIKKLAGWLKQNPTVRLEIIGHTDNDGTDAFNMKLSQERAGEVKKQLVAFGINALRLTTKGYGATIPIQPNTTAEGKADNRRVEFIKR